MPQPSSPTVIPPTGGEGVPPTGSGGSGTKPPRRPVSRRVYLRRRIVALVLLVVVLAGAGSTAVYANNAANATLPLATGTITAPAIADVPDPAIVWPASGAAAIGAVGFDGVLAASGSDAPVPIASITKVVTALVVLDAKPLAAGEDGPDIAFGAADVGYYNEQIAQNGSVAPVSDGLVLNEREALTVMMLPSANNYATSLAIWAYGSEDAYLDAVRGWLAARGLTGTSITDTSGLSPSSVSTPTDLVALGKIAIQEPALAAIVGLKSADVPGVGVVENTNDLLGIQGIDGMKTGTTDEAGACLLFTLDATVDGRAVTLVGVLLGGPGSTHPSINQAIEALIPGVVSGFRTVTVSTAGEEYGTLTTEWGESVEVVSGTDASAFVWGSEAVASSVATEQVATIEDGARLGAATVTVGAQTFEVPLVVEGSLEDPGFGWRVTHPDELFAGR